LGEIVGWKTRRCPPYLKIRLYYTCTNAGCGSFLGVIDEVLRVVKNIDEIRFCCNLSVTIFS
jgi:hypothetical protein